MTIEQIIKKDCSDSEKLGMILSFHMNHMINGDGAITIKVWYKLIEDLISWKNAPENTSSKSDYAKCRCGRGAAGSGPAMSKMTCKSSYVKKGAKMEWISVKDRLPDDYTTYLVCSDEDGTVWFMDYCGSGWESCDSDGESKIYKADITHWMPLPKTAPFIT